MSAKILNRLAPAWIAALLLLGLSPALLAKSHPEILPVDETLHCRVESGGVALEWNVVFIAPILGFVISRDGVEIAKLPPDATSYFDREVGPGDHAYLREAINWNGEHMTLGKCAVTVGEPGLRCQVEENRIHLSWGPILIDVLILKFRISRNGEILATVPPDQLSYDDAVNAVGDYTYEVHAVTSPDSEFLVGSCSVRIECFLLDVSVDGLTVKLDWSRVPIPLGQAIIIEPIFIVTRDNELVVKTREMAATDTVPSPGVYLYQVYMDFGTGGIPVIPVAACRVQVSGGQQPPAPEDLVCRVIIPVPEPGPLLDDATWIDLDGDGQADGTFPAALVFLKWSNPVAYDQILITRNKAIVATLPGDQTEFQDRVAASGLLIYGVYGIVGNSRSLPAECRVEIPPVIVPPPQDFTCELLDLILDPLDPANPLGIPGGGDATIIAPFPVVLLKWWNPVPYARLILARDGVEIARLPGDAMMYRDLVPPGGVHVYSLFGIAVDGRRSPTVECTIDTGGEPVPPVADLQCQVITSATDPAINMATVILVWKNAARYDRIFIFRDGALLAELSGEDQKYADRGVATGVYLYEVVALRAGRKSPPAACQVVVDGPVQRNLLYFTSGLEILPDPGNLPPDPEPVPPLPGNRLTCLADNARPVQGWSFGVSTDPQFVIAVSIDLSRTITSTFNGGTGPDFLHLEVVAGGAGVVMAAVISTSGGSEILPPDRGHRLLNIEYGAGPAGVAGQSYPVRYTNTLGDPPVQILFVVGGFEVKVSTLPGWVSLPGPRFLRGDVNGDLEVDQSDAIVILKYLFLGRDPIGCLEAANANGTREVNIADPIYLLNWRFIGGPAPPPPFPRCGSAPAPLGCEKPPASCELEPVPQQ
ncbi:MAG: hypothetical protein HY717_14395 [Planctomycetes bacterium]|nr:hypothetical protein [Planctomycetota bacterium]